MCVPLRKVEALHLLFLLVIFIAETLMSVGEVFS